MKKNLLFLIFILTGSTFVLGQGNDQYVRDYLIKWENSKEYTLKVLELMPADQYDFSPAPEEMSFKKLSMHILQNMIWLSTDYLEGPGFEHDLKTIEPSKEELIEITKKAYDYSIDAVKDLSPHLLETKVDFFAGPMTLRKIMELMDDHCTHHRAQLAVYLRIKEIKPPRYVGW